MHPYPYDKCEQPPDEDATPARGRGLAPALDDGEIFRQLIKTELRNGRLTPSRRRRIVRYAAKLRMSAVEAGQLIARCREEALQSDHPTERFHALRLVEPETGHTPITLRISLVIALAILVDLLVLGWPWR